MVTLIGRLTADAKVSILKDERKVVNFTIAINDSYKQKGSKEAKKFTTFVNCSYWISDAIVEHLKKGVLVELHGRISASAYTNLSGDAVPNLNLHVHNIKMHGKGNAQSKGGPIEENKRSLPKDDLPF